ncbi:hypothetical protein Pd630_LPD03337 [Rhodococcus opacus PD630]|nr:hypothetical protein Pd630_LPD03337 [Rhodococcus opacus PD630]
MPLRLLPLAKPLTCPRHPRRLVSSHADSSRYYPRPRPSPRLTYRPRGGGSRSPGAFPAACSAVRSSACSLPSPAPSARVRHRWLRHLVRRRRASTCYRMSEKSDKKSEPSTSIVGFPVLVRAQSVAARPRPSYVGRPRRTRAVLRPWAGVDVLRGHCFLGVEDPPGWIIPPAAGTRRGSAVATPHALPHARSRRPAWPVRGSLTSRPGRWSMRRRLCWWRAPSPSPTRSFCRRSPSFAVSIPSVCATASRLRTTPSFFAGCADERRYIWW